jgi:hypothetical protein
MDFESVSNRAKHFERILGKYGKFQHIRKYKDYSKENLKSMIEMFTTEKQTIFHYGVYDTVLAKICLKAGRKYIGVAGDFYDKLKPEFKKLKEKYDPKPKKVKEKVKPTKVKKSKKKKRK